MTSEPTAADAKQREPSGDTRLRRLVVGQGLAAVVDALFLIWLTLFVLKLSEPGMTTGFVLVAVALPRTLLLLPAGVLVDRVGPGRVAAVAAWLRVGVLLALTVIVVSTSTSTSPSVTTVAILAGLLGIADAAYFPAALALLPAVAPAAKLPQVNALVQGAESGGDLIGPAVAAGVIAAVGFEATLAGITVVAASAALALVSLRRVAKAAEADHDAEPQSSARALAAGLRHAWNEPLVRGMLAAVAVINIAVVGPVIVGGAVLADQRLGGAGALGIVLSGFGAGALTGSLLAGLLPSDRRGWIVVGGVAAIGAGTAGLAAVTHVIAATAVVSLAGIGSGFLGVVIVATLQESVPEGLRGRVLSLVVLATVAFDPISYALAGALLPYGTTVLFLASGGAVLACAALMATSPAMRTLR
ncbi:MFS transporter [Streptomyces alboniger]|uniref:Multidrug efflux pump Tap n=1 Tax=Streptomyces alboniger TaxID=132473 RepID=A0A5J6HA96_STRAD|nr:MFS transporter [Streptomyces alboniger]QEV16538.1 MFS transporter [Streptomyces alboniger]